MSGADAISLPNVMVIEYASASRSKRNNNLSASAMNVQLLF